MSVEFVKPTPVDVAYIADRMREADIVEVLASGAQSPRQAIEFSLGRSAFSAVAKIHGEPCAVFGLVRDDLITGVGSPWLLGTDLIEKHAKTFVTCTRRGVAEMLDICPLLSNHVHIEHSSSIRWLKRLGFQFDAPQPIGVNGELFARFHLEK